MRRRSRRSGDRVPRPARRTRSGLGLPKAPDRRAPGRGQVGLAGDQEGWSRPRDQNVVLFPEWLRVVEHLEHQVCRRGLAQGSIDPRLLDRVVGARTPAVSTSSTGQPSSAVATVTTSRVVPGAEWTIALWYPARALSSRLFPTLGRPAITTRQPVINRSRPAPLSMRRSICSAAVAVPSRIFSITRASSRSSAP